MPTLTKVYTLRRPQAPAAGNGGSRSTKRGLAFFGFTFEVGPFFCGADYNWGGAHYTPGALCAGHKFDAPGAETHHRVAQVLSYFLKLCGKTATA